MSISEIKLVAFGNPNRDDNAYKILSYSNSIGAVSYTHLRAHET